MHLIIISSFDRKLNTFKSTHSIPIKIHHHYYMLLIELTNRDAFNLAYLVVLEISFPPFHLLAAPRHWHDSVYQALYSP
jgi:hypothetical protein